MTTKSRQSIYGASVRAAAERAKEARKEADRLACEAWNKRMLGFRGPAQLSPTLGDALILIGLIHHTDHVLRVDHSGWPFRADLNPFTFSLLAYPISLFALLGPARLFWLRWLVLLVGAGFTIWAHFMIETPGMQYAMWAHNHSPAPQQPDTLSLLGLQSTALGLVAVGVSMTLNLLVVAGVLSMLWDGMQRPGT